MLDGGRLGVFVSDRAVVAPGFWPAPGHAGVQRLFYFC